MKFILVAALVAVADSYSYYQDRIPNASNIPNPCPDVRGTIWSGVGHRNHEGGGSRNPFGRDFGRNNFVWDECLCQQDSDGDGKTNGEELGDPDCVWTLGAEPLIRDISMLSHPGICEPLDSRECQVVNYWLDCSSMAPFECDAFDADDTQRVDMTIPLAPVPAQETTFVCTFMEFPQEIQDGDFHMIGAEAVIDNTAIMHHLIVYACPDDENITRTMMKSYGTTRECGNMVTESCSSILYTWGIGIDGSCFDPEFGVRLGEHGFKMFVMEFHWNNPEELAGQMDASGVRFYYTPTLRQYDAITVYIANVYLEIPPGRERFVEDGVCPSRCTSQMIKERIFIPQIIPHMHLLGREFVMEHYRDGTLLRTLIQEDNYDYNRPRTHKFNPHIEVLPGDELRVRCVFDSTNQDDFTFWGSATSDEMCIAIAMYYPYQASMSNCWSFKDGVTGACFGDFYGDVNYYSCFATVSEDVFWDSFYLPYLGYYQRLSMSCDIDGLSCFPGCEEVISSIKRHPCFSDEAVSWTSGHFLPRVLPSLQLPIPPPDFRSFIKGMASCDHYDEIHDDTSEENKEEDSGNWNTDSCIFAHPTPDVSAAIGQAEVSMGLLACVILARVI